MRRLQNATRRQCIPLNTQNLPQVQTAARSPAKRLRVMALGAAAVALMSLVNLSSAESRPFDAAPAADASELGPHAQRCVEMAMGHSVRRLAFEAALHQETIDAMRDERLAGALDAAKSRCHAAFETAKGGYNQFNTADWRG